MNSLCILLLMIGIVACSSPERDVTDNKHTDTEPDVVSDIGSGKPGIVGISGMTEWEQLPDLERQRIKKWNTLFMHQSVGGDLEDGAAANGFRFEYFDLTVKPQGLCGNVFSASNGDPFGKMAEFKRNVLEHKTTVKIVIFKFGYADINDENREQVKVAYHQMVDELRKQIPDLRFVHITPPLIYILSRDDGNAAKMNVGKWMKDTFGSKDVIYELQEIESGNGSCKIENVLSICDQYRSTKKCPSKNQGIDAPEGQGHICEAAAMEFSKALLMSIYKAGK